MPFFKRRPKRPSDDAEVIEMGPEQEEERGPPMEPGKPIPYDASSWSPPAGGDGESRPMYQTGSAALEPRPGTDPYKPREHSEVMDGTHVVTKPRGQEARESAGPTVRCRGCGARMEVPRGRPVEVQCPECGRSDVLR